MNSPQLSANWEKAKILNAVFASVLIPIVIALIAQGYSSATKDREVGAQYVELAVSILRAEPTPETRSLRDWAIKTINHYSPIPLGEDARQELQLRSLAVEMQGLLEQRRLGLDSASTELKQRYDTAKVPISTMR